VNRPRRQDFAPNEIPYDENGSLYIFTQKHFEKTGNRLGGKIGYITFSERYGHQIDTLDDFTFLESLAHKN
jgi:CMP-N-acetylneuraminic acid synthetase